MTSLVFFDIEAEVSDLMALYVSNGDAPFIIGSSDNAVAWTTVQHGLATGSSIESWQVGVTSARERDWLLCVIPDFVVHGTEDSLSNWKSALDETTVVT